MPEKRWSSTPTAYAVICPKHEQIFLTHEEYIRQLEAPDSKWVCPYCNRLAEFDDANYEKAMEAQDEEA